MKKSALYIVLACLAAPAWSAQPDFPHIETSGYGEVTAVPDMAEFSVQVVETSLTAEQAKQAVDKVVSSFLKRLTSAGVSRDQIQAASLHLSPHYQYPKSGERELVGFQASRQVRVTVYELENLNTYLDGALGDGINRVDNIQLKVKDRQRYQELARQAAIKDAISKASSLAEGFGAELGGIWKVSYHNSQPQPVLMRGMAMDAKMESFSGYEDSSVLIRDSVNVTYYLEQK